MPPVPPMPFTARVRPAPMPPARAASGPASGRGSTP